MPLPLAQVGPGAYDRALQAKGYPSSSSCARDCLMLCGVSVPPSYCEGGVEADAVLSITKPPAQPGAAGSGTHCASDARGRPLWLVFSWLLPLSQLSSPLSSLIERHRGLVYHEVIHGMGFSNAMFSAARGPDGSSKGLLSLRRVEDADGASDEVWHFVKGRAYEAGSRYFGCEGNSSWLGVPLMGASPHTCPPLCSV